MSNRNFEFRVSPRHGNRGARYVTDSAGSAIPSGAPVLVDGTENDGMGRQQVVLATGAQDKPLSGEGGILVFESIQHIGVDPLQVTYSDADVAAAGAAAQVVSGPDGKVALTNSEAGSGPFGGSTYPATRVMVAGVSIATPTVAVGDYLTPGVGTDADGYWAETSTASEAWLVVTAVDGDTVEAKINF